VESRRKSEREYDRIAASRISKIKGGIPLHVAIGDMRSITLRNKLKRMGLKGPHIDDLISLVDEIGIQKTLNDMPLGVRFATVKSKKNRPKIWKS
jgi:hypothetical protein